MKKGRNTDAALAIERAIGGTLFDAEGTAEEFRHVAHRTNQQTFTRLCIAWLERCAQESYPCDMRNKASHDAAKMLIDGLGGKDLPPLPYI